ncbi:membrane-associated cytochrome [Proteus vulgaris]|nr:membrane-associated cytochrome [Proteus vulgaris]
MQWRNNTSRYGHLSLILHWGSALTVYGMFALGLWMVTLGYYDSWYHSAPEIHKSIGILLFIVLILRVIWRWMSPPPKALSSYSKFTRISAHIAHMLLYFILFSILISGYLISHC